MTSPTHCITGPTRAATTARSAAMMAMVVVIATVTGCGARDRRTPDDTLVALIGAEIKDIDPRYALTNHDIKISRLVAPGLTSVDQPSVEPKYELAQTIVQRGPLLWEVTLRDDVRFSDGTPVTAADVVYSYEVTMATDSDSLYRKGFVERYQRVEAADARTVRFHLTKPLATFLTDMDFGIFSKAAAEAHGGRFPDGEVIGAGPYKVESKSPDGVRLRANPHYFGAAPKIPRIHVRTVRDADARTFMLVGGSADFTQNSLRLDLIDAIAARERLHVVSGPSIILTYLMMHNEDPILSDVRVRRAIAYAIDRERIVRVKFGGRAVLATGLLAPSHWAYHGDVDRYLHDPDRARALLDEAGYPDPDGPGGQPRLSLSYKTSSDPFRLTLARIIASQLGEVGIDVTVRSFEFGTFFSDIKKGNYQLASMQTADITDPDYYFSYYHSSRIPTEKDPHTGNRWRYRNDRVDALTEEGRRVADRGERIRIYRQVQEILARELPVIPLWHEDNVAVMHRDVTDYQILPNARYAGWVGAIKAR